MKPDIAKNILQSEIKNIASNSEVYSIKPKSDFIKKGNKKELSFVRKPNLF